MTGNEWVVIAGVVAVYFVIAGAVVFCVWRSERRANTSPTPGCREPRGPGSARTGVVQDAQGSSIAINRTICTDQGATR